MRVLHTTKNSLLILGTLALCFSTSYAQAGRRPGAAAADRALTLNVIATRTGNPNASVTADDLALYDGGIEQKIQSFAPDPSPARIVLLVDNSLTLRTDPQRLAGAVSEFAYEIYEGDQLMLVGYNEAAEIAADWTDDPKKLAAAATAFTKRGEPHLFDALSAVVNEALRPLTGARQKRIIVVIGDGLDRGSKTKFNAVLTELQAQDITVYALQIPDRTGGALRRDQPKPAQVIQQLAENTGGQVFPLDDSRAAAQTICDELRKNRYVLAYTPFNVSYSDARRLLLSGSEGINLRYKTMQPPK
ncbi:MAG: VWA domain-containing protein [Pyrinomonadaceae bacterium]|nr:VWA domain-containing protein [Pyrinomonadaceae bacterium]